jgi:hypothetical protein
LQLDALLVGVRVCDLRAVVDSIVERWFPEADTNTVLVFLERETDAGLRDQNEMRFIRLRRPLAQIIPSPGAAGRRGAIESFLEEMIEGERDPSDPRMQINQMLQGAEGGLMLAETNDDPDLLDEDDE